MKKVIKSLLICVSGLALLTGCSKGELDSSGTNYGYVDNLSHEEVYRQIKEKMKSEMDKIGFTVDFSNYEFYTKIMQTEGVTGTVSMKDKRYPNYGSILVYQGDFGSKKKNQTIDLTKVAINPIIFIENGYQDYVVKNVFNNKELGNDLDGALKETRGEVIEFISGYNYPERGYPSGNNSPEKVLKYTSISTTNFLYSKTFITEEVYIDYFRNKNNIYFDYETFFKKMNFFALVGIYINKTDSEITDIQNNMTRYFNQETLVIRVTNYKVKGR